MSCQGCDGKGTERELGSLVPSTCLDRRGADSVKKPRAEGAFIVSRSPAFWLGKCLGESASPSHVGEVLVFWCVFGSSVNFGYRGSAPRHGYLTAEALGPAASVAPGVDRPIAFV